MSVPWQSTRDARGLLLVSAGTGPVSSWVRRGLVACQVVPRGAWTALVPAEPASRAQPPYDEAVTVLAARPVPRRLRPALGFFSVDGRAVVTVQPKGWRSGRHWLVWEPGVGVLRLPDLEAARLEDLVGAAGSRHARAEVSGVLADTRGGPDRLLAALMRALALPGAELLPASTTLHGQVVAPTAQAVARFEARVADEARDRAEHEES